MTGLRRFLRRGPLTKQQFSSTGRSGLVGIMRTREKMTYTSPCDRSSRDRHPCAQNKETDLFTGDMPGRSRGPPCTDERARRDCTPKALFRVFGQFDVLRTSDLLSTSTLFSVLCVSYGIIWHKAWYGIAA